MIDVSENLSVTAISHSMIGKRAKTHRKHKILPTRVSPHVESTRVTVLSIPQVPATEPARVWGSDGTTVLKALDNDIWGPKDRPVSAII